ncbi:hypothetical protein [Streptomyces sp. C10-9-1]|uniref:hypothetical protein n=1 Tax=Streptomyces sp. C10-9-1 TaxID=1859285 RepID=UPI003D739370
MTTAPRPPFSVRVGLTDASAHDELLDDVPEHLLVPLQTWVEDALSYRGSPQEDQAQPICLRLHIAPSRDPRWGVRYVKPLTQTFGPQLLNVVDEVLSPQSGG